MKKRFFPVMLLAAALGFTSCADDSLAEGAGGNLKEDDGKRAYITAGISLPSSAFTRSETDNPTGGDNDKTNSNGAKDEDGNQLPDYEEGYDYENDVRSMILVIADAEDKYIAHSVIQGITQTPTTGSKFDFEITGEFKHSDIAKAYEPGNASFGKDKTGVHMYAICNYTAKLLDLFENGENGSWDNWINWAGEVIEAGSPAGQTPTITNTIWAKRSFLMTNAESAESNGFTFPETIDEWDQHADKNHPYELTNKPIKVERAAARLDFKDGSPTDTEANTYKLETIVGKKDKEGSTTDEKEDDIRNFFNVKLTRMALVNMSKNFYYLRRTSDDGQAKSTSNNWKVGGAEKFTTGNDGKVYNYVVDTDAAQKANRKETGLPYNEAKDLFNFTLFKSDDKSYNKEGWYVDNISDVLKSDKEDDTWNGGGNYKIWRYVTENTIPSPEDNQVVSQSTGIVFKGAIVTGKNIIDSDVTDHVSSTVIEALKKASLEDKSTVESLPTLYSFNNSLYASIAELVSAAKEDQYGGSLYTAVNNILKNWKIIYNASDATPTEGEFAYNTNEVETGKKALELDIITYDAILNKKQDDETPKFTVKDLTEEKFISLAPAQKITIYEATDDDEDGLGYYCYYFYWNRHNDNLLSGKMGPMEFATVRNNVYKLSVSKISQLGHPRKTEHDPDPEKPDTPDEDPTNYITVNVEVLPWVVRVNDIEF